MRRGSEVPWRCNRKATEAYIVDKLGRDAVVAAGLGRAAFDASTAYSFVRAGWGAAGAGALRHGGPIGRCGTPAPTLPPTLQGGGLGADTVAAGIRSELPWLRLVLSMREPISREISGRVHLMELNTRAQGPPPTMHNECLRLLAQGKASMYQCVLPHLTETNATRYAESLEAWLAAWPRDQLHVIQARRRGGGTRLLWGCRHRCSSAAALLARRPVHRRPAAAPRRPAARPSQFENLTAPATHGAVLEDLQRFLGLDPVLAPPTLPLANSRKAAKPEGWPMRRSEYQHLLGIAKSRANRCAAGGAGGPAGLGPAAMPCCLPALRLPTAAASCRRPCRRCRRVQAGGCAGGSRLHARAPVAGGVGGGVAAQPGLV